MELSSTARKLNILLVSLCVVGALLCLHGITTDTPFRSHIWLVKNSSKSHPVTTSYLSKVVFRSLIKARRRYISYPGFKELQLKYNTCAYVTSSGHMLHSNLGNEIDSHDCVIRSNNAPTIGYEKDVGVKTTIRTVAKGSLRTVIKELKENPHCIDEMILNDTIILGWNWRKELYSHFNKCLTNWPDMKLHIIDRGFMNDILRYFQDSMRTKLSEVPILISNGFYTLFLAHDVCERIDVYGMNYPNYCKTTSSKEKKSVPYHYYRNNTTECAAYARLENRTLSHRFADEKKAFLKMSKQFGKLHFYSPEWPDT